MTGGPVGGDGHVDGDLEARVPGHEWRSQGKACATSPSKHTEVINVDASDTLGHALAYARPLARSYAVAGHLTQPLGYRLSYQVLLQSLYHFRRVWYTSYYYSKYGSNYRILQYGSG